MILAFGPGSLGPLLFDIVNGNVNERDGRVALWSGEIGAPVVRKVSSDPKSILSRDE
jgi:hypothetical protein